MDLNYLFHRRGVSLMLADHADCLASRDAYLGLARRYAARIAAALRPHRAVTA